MVVANSTLILMQHGGQTSATRKFMSDWRKREGNGYFILYYSYTLHAQLFYQRGCHHAREECYLTPANFNSHSSLRFSLHILATLPSVVHKPTLLMSECCYHLVQVLRPNNWRWMDEHVIILARRGRTPLFVGWIEEERWKNQEL